METLQYGAKNALTAREIATLCNTSTRAISAAIHRLRVGGVIILSSTEQGTQGYYLPADNAEIERFVKSMKSRAREIQRAYQGAAAVVRGE